MKTSLFCLVLFALLCSVNIAPKHIPPVKMYESESVYVEQFDNGDGPCYAIKLNNNSQRIRSKYFAYKNAEGEVSRRYNSWAKDKDLILVTAGAYADYMDQTVPAGITMDSGAVINERLSSYEGLVMISATGSVWVADLADKEGFVVPGDSSRRRFYLADYIDRSLFIDMGRKLSLTAFQTHILVYRNRIKIDPKKSSTNVAARRFLVGVKDGTNVNYLILGTSQFKTLFEFTTIALDYVHKVYDTNNVTAEVLFMVNMDTGAQDIFELHDANGNISELTGRVEIERAANLFAFYQE